MGAHVFVDVGELDAEGPGGMVRKVRRALDAKAFGLNYFVFPPDQVDAAATRVPISGADGLELVTIGAPLEGRYEPPSWG